MEAWKSQAVPKKLNEKSIILDHSPIIRWPADYPAFHPESGKPKGAGVLPTRFLSNFSFAIDNAV